MCELKPTILFINSVLNPFITDMTIIKTATPRLIPMKEKIDITFKKPSFFLAFKNLKVISFSKVEIQLDTFCFVIISIILSIDKFCVSLPSSLNSRRLPSVFYPKQFGKVHQLNSFFLFLKNSFHQYHQ